MTGHLTYSSYLHLPELLATTRPNAACDDSMTWAGERYFIICHQSSELWLSQILVDLGESARFSQEGAWSHSTRRLWRVSSMVELLIQQLGRLVYLSRADFQRFRPSLQGASGAQSAQCLEVLQIADQPDIRAIGVNLAVVLADHGLDRPHQLGACRHDSCGAAHAVDHLIATVGDWRRLHLQVARHFIGDSPGSGGSDGVAYLRAQLDGSSASPPSQSATAAAPSCGQEK